jgi:hypothetical protein
MQKPSLVEGMPGLSAADMLAAQAGELLPRFDAASIRTLAGIGCRTVPDGDPAARVTDQKSVAQAGR